MLVPSHGNYNEMQTPSLGSKPFRMCSHHTSQASSLLLLFVPNCTSQHTSYPFLSPVFAVPQTWNAPHHLPCLVRIMPESPLPQAKFDGFSVGCHRPAVTELITLYCNYLITFPSLTLVFCVCIPKGQGTVFHICSSVLYKVLNTSLWTERKLKRMRMKRNT